jgi:hypothetical protein
MLIIYLYPVTLLYRLTIMVTTISCVVDNKIRDRYYKLVSDIYCDRCNNIKIMYYYKYLALSGLRRDIACSQRP